MKPFRRTFLAAVAATMAFGGTACAQTGTATETYAPTVGQAGKDVIWVPSPQALVDRMLDMAQLTPRDRLVDLGSGDGRTVITAAKRGAKARGIEFNPDMVEMARRNAQAEGVSDRATFEQGDIFESDFSEATVVTLFLLPSLNLRLRPILLDMPPGTRIVANSFDMGEWQADETADVGGDCTSYCRALKWIVPAKVAGTWVLDGKTLELTQSFQMLEGTLRDGAATRPITQARLEGTQVRFAIGKDRYVGRVDGNRMQGTVNGSRQWQAARRRS
ncbi:methyltransferase domain-containing protein [Comamonas sp. SCN 65-56]|uniref:SAM-dependent methyltransferase n=1 Tax=Comamonas sp. SCN 65-56 TaxID=1660095 RepID=UPI000B33C0A0|nr:methyltransferase domain-containing protein [Comamonas sp. SCN 65-56]